MLSFEISLVKDSWKELRHHALIRKVAAVFHSFIFFFPHLSLLIFFFECVLRPVVSSNRARGSYNNPKLWLTTSTPPPKKIIVIVHVYKNLHINEVHIHSWSDSVVISSCVLYSCLKIPFFPNDHQIDAEYIEMVFHGHCTSYTGGEPSDIKYTYSMWTTQSIALIAC